MTYKNLWVFLVGVLALVLVAQSVSATFGTISDIQVNGISANSGVVNFAGFNGQKIPVTIRFDATAHANDVRIKAWISGSSGNSVALDRIEVFPNASYIYTVYVDMPSDLGESINEPRKLEITVESKTEGTADEKTINLALQRESYSIQILSADMNTQVNAGDPLIVDVVIKNIGGQLAEDTFLKVKLPELRLETKSYFGDLSSVDQSNPDRQDAVERRAFIRLPAETKAGVYTVILEAFNADSVDRIERKILVVGAEGDTMVVPSTSDKTFLAGQNGEYTLTIVNKGTQVRVYGLDVVTPSDLSIDVSDPVVVVPAGSSRAVKLTASSSTEGKYAFTVNVKSGDQVLDSRTFRANVNGTEKASAGANTTVLLTVILAIVFVVLLVVLIVLLTRKPEKQEELGESSYY